MAVVNLPETIDPEMTVDEIMRRWPMTIRVFMRHGMLCTGCPIGIFHTVADACQAHRLDIEPFSVELLQTMRRDLVASGPSAFLDDHVLRPAGRMAE
jgi:hybrid cluster-associated redox disulfide protein